MHVHLLFLTNAPPWPPRRGYQMRLAGLISHLSPRHRISVLAQRPPGFAAAPPPAGVELRLHPVSRVDQARGLLSSWRLPLQVALYDVPGFDRAVGDTIDELEPDIAVGVLARLGPVLLDLPLPTVVDLVDCLGLNMAQRAVRQPWLRPFWLWESRRMLDWERRLVQRLDAATVVSERDRAALAASGPLDRLPEVVPLGLEPSETPAHGRRKVVLLSGNLGYFPTVEGALWFAREVWPRVLAAVPDAELWLAGSRPARPLVELAGRPGVRLLRDPEDLGAIRRQAAVAIAPLRAGSGTAIKILEAMADELPVVTTSFGHQGLDAIEGGEVRLADHPEDFAAAVEELLRAPEAAREQVQAASSWLWRRHALAASGDAFERLLERVAAAGRNSGNSEGEILTR